MQSTCTKTKATQHFGNLLDKRANLPPRRLGRVGCKNSPLISLAYYNIYF